MPRIEALRGLRYDLGHIGSLSDVVAPPYDVISPELQEQLYKRHPSNVIRLILNRSEPGDGADDRYGRAARFLKNWQAEGVLQREPDPAIYVYHQEFSYGGTTFTRRGFMSRVKLERFGEGNIYPHEETHAAAKADRLKLTTACRANLSQIFGIYPDRENEAQQILEDAIREVAPCQAEDHLGVIHRIWPVTEVGTIADVAAVLANKPLFVADGHHRYETACNYRDQLHAESDLPADHPANFVLTMCVGMDDPGMIVLPTHRLFRGVPELTAQQLREKLSPGFELTAGGEGLSQSAARWEEIEVEGSQGVMAFYTRADRQWTVARVSQGGMQMMEQAAEKQSGDWRGLGVSLLHRLAVQTLLGLSDLPKPKYVHLVEELEAEGDAEDFNLSALVMPATLDHIRAISENGERMPAKSTYFYPKLLSGLVINPLA